MKKSIQLFALSGIMLISISMKDQDKVLKESMALGKAVYTGVGMCMTCHMAEGEGMAGIFPPLAKSDYLMDDLDRSIKSLIEGLQGEIEVNGTKYNAAMPASGLA